MAGEEVFKKITRISGLLAILSGVAGIAGNITGISLISSVCPGCNTIALSAALIWIFFGAILVSLTIRPRGRTAFILLRVVLVIIAVASGAELLSGLAGGHFITESWFMAAGAVMFGPLSSAMSPIAAGLIIIAAFGLFFAVDPDFLSADHRPARQVSVAAGIIITLTGFTFVLSYFFGNPYFFGSGILPIAAISAFAAVCIGAGLIAAAGPETSPACYFVGSSIRATLLRNFVSLTIVIALVENIIFHIISSWYQLSNAILLSTGIVIFVIVTALIVGRLSGRIGLSIDNAEHALVCKNKELAGLNDELTSAEEKLRQNLDDLTRADRALMESEERLRRHVDNSPLGVIGFDAQFRITLWSGEATRIFGWTREEVMGKRIGEFRWIHEDDADRTTAILSSMTSGKSTRNVHSNRNYRKDGSIIDCEWYNSAIRDHEGNLVSIHSQVLDVTSRVKTEEALRESERFLRETEKNAKLGGWAANPHTDYLMWTEGIYDIIEAPRSYRPGFSEGSKYFSKNDQHLIREKIEQCLATGAPFTLEVEITTGTGRKVWTELRGLAPITEGMRESVTGTFQDISERRSIEEKLKKESGKLDLLADAARLLLSAEKPERIVPLVGERVMGFLNCNAFFNYLIDADGHRMRLNAYAGISAEEAAGIEYLDYGPAACGRVARDDGRIVAGGIFYPDDESACAIRSLGVTGIVCHPLVYQGRTLGTLSFGNCDRSHFTDEEVDLMRAVGDLIATAMARKNIESSLRSTSEYLENLIDHANAPIIVWDREFRILRFNRAFERLTGMTSEMMIGSSLDMLFPETTRTESMDHIGRTGSGDRWESVEIPIRHVSGAIRIVLWNSANLYDDDSVTISSTIAQGQDITERKTAEASAERTASLLNAALDSTADGILAVDTNAIITSYNNIFCTIWGVPEGTLDGAEEKIALSYMIPLVADAREFSARLKELHAHSERESYDTVRLKDGRIFERYSKPQKIGDIIVGRVWSYRDITERRHAEIALRESLEKFRIIATNTPDHITVQDRNLRYIQVINPLPGLREQDMMGKNDYDILSKKDADTLTALKKHVLESGTAVHREIPVTGSHGEIHFFAGSYVPRRDANGEVDGLIGYFRNVTEAKQSNEKIVAALAEKEILIREIHHRVKNNLQIISGLLDMTRMRSKDPLTTGILTDMMMKIRTMAQIHTRLYESKQFDRVNMGGQIRDQVVDLANIYARAGPRITCQVDAGEIYLPVDLAIPCALVVNEALSNAFKHAFVGRLAGSVLVSAQHAEGNVRICIQDDGTGIPADIDINRATSLGLKLIRNLVQQVNGTLKIESTAQGSRVSIEFPLTREGG